MTKARVGFKEHSLLRETNTKHPQELQECDNFRRDPLQKDK